MMIICSPVGDCKSQTVRWQRPKERENRRWSADGGGRLLFKTQGMVPARTHPRGGGGGGRGYIPPPGAQFKKKPGSATEAF